MRVTIAVFCFICWFVVAMIASLVMGLVYLLTGKSFELPTNKAGQ